MSESPIEQLLGAFDERDVDRAVALLSPDVRILTADGRHAEGAQDVRNLLGSFFASLRSTTHRITGQWHVDNVWIAELEASYELRDWLDINALPRACFVRTGTQGVSDVRMYGAHEHPLTSHRTGDEATMVGGRMMLPL